MNRLWGDGEHGPWMTCILEPGNMYRLTNHQPIEIKLADGAWKDGIPQNATLVIAYSETPIADQKKLEQLVGGPQNVEDRRTAVSEKKRPHCPECKSTIEQLGVWRSAESPLWLTFCYVCGCVFGVSKPIQELGRKP